MPPEDLDALRSENERLAAQLGALKEVLSQEIAAKASLQQSLNAASARYLELTERAPWIVVRVDTNGRYVDANKQANEALAPGGESILDSEIGSCGESAAWIEALRSFQSASE
ncbi:MAG: hypothetical protein AAGG01_08490, partial [Planctomycetota bacterium]